MQLAVNASEVGKNCPLFFTIPFVVRRHDSECEISFTRHPFR